MSQPQHHTIRRELLDIAVSGTEAEGFAAQRRVADLCRDWLGPALDEALGRVVPPDEHWVIDRLEIDAGAFGIDTLDRDFVRAVADAVQTQIRDRAGGRGGAISQRTPAEAIDRAGLSRGAALQGEADASSAIHRRSDAQAVQDAFFYFLATGALPWWYRLAPGQSLESATVASWPSGIAPATFVESVRRSAEAATARTRLARQFSSAFLTRILHRLAPQDADTVAAVLVLIAHAALSAIRTQHAVESLWLAVFGAAEGQAMADAWRQLAPLQQSEAERAVAAQVANLLSLQPMTTVPARDASVTSPAGAPAAPSNMRGQETIATADAAKRPPRATSPHRIDLDDGVFVECAGVVLLHPFLPRLFAALGIAKDGRLLAPDRALALLHFLAAGERQAPEYALVLAKRLCGLSLEEPCGAPHRVTDAEAEEGDGLLKAVIGHWEALGGSSIDALRGTFLVRPGKLGRRDDDDVLHVENRAFDVLLERLPWGISLVQLPWMRKLLWVEWRA